MKTKRKFIHHSFNTPSSTACCRIDHVFTAILAKAMPSTEGLTEAITYALTQDLALQNSFRMIWFTDKNLVALATMKNSHNNQLYASVATKKKHGAKRKNDVQSFAHGAL